MVLIFNDLFWSIHGQKSEVQFQIKLSYLEIYNEIIWDLLSEYPTVKGLEMWEDA